MAKWVWLEQEPTPPQADDSRVQMAVSCLTGCRPPLVKQQPRFCAQGPALVSQVARAAASRLDRRYMGDCTGARMVFGRWASATKIDEEDVLPAQPALSPPLAPADAHDLRRHGLR